MCGCSEPFASNSGQSSSNPQGITRSMPAVLTPDVPLAQKVTIETAGAPAPGGGPGPQPGAGPVPGLGPAPFPFPNFKFCLPGLRSGCYAINFQPLGSPLFGFEGTLRVDRSAPDGGPDNIIVSGDLYRRLPVIHPLPIPIPVPGPLDPGPLQPGPLQPGPVQPGLLQPAAPQAGAADSPSVAARASAADVPVPFPLPPLSLAIPIFPRGRYHSYLKVISVQAPVIVLASQPCTVTIVLEQYDYTAPAAGSFQGSFPAAASRTVTLALTVAPPHFAGFGPDLTGRWIEGGVDKGAVSLTWVSDFFRRASVEIDTLVGAVAPQAVPDGAGGSEYFRSIYAKHGWDLTVVSDEVNVPVPAKTPPIDPDDCWSAGDLHGLMTAHRNPATNLDLDWHIHLMVVPAKLGCGRGVMYDTIDVPREGCASFCDDGYPSGESASFGTAANQKQRDVPRAFLRSATHEITHTFNQIHQEQETMADNSIMTTTPSVADVLGGPVTGDPGVFPDQINLAVNTTVRHHLVHMPDPVIRPGGWPFASWFGNTVPQATDRHLFDAAELELTVTAASASVALGQPLELSWTLTNRSGGGLIVPGDVRLEGLFASMAITDPDGTQRPFRSYVIVCDNVKLAELSPGGTVSAAYRVFWSSDGLAFPRPGHYRVTVAVTWSAQGVPVGVRQDIDVFVEYPTTVADNDAAGLVLNGEVGKWVALGGNAYHLTEATRRLNALRTGTFDSAPRLLAGYDGLMPDADRM
jgi:hypothetical protein